MTRNRLDQETSPYLLQHKDNPVHWQPWDDEALALARRENKPILLSVGYAACHWCHVMAHESFEDPETAALMNAHFVNIKVDREERPDLDGIYQTALALLGQQGGWPLTMFLTPEGEPFWGGTYFPPVAHYGRPAFRDVLKGIAEVYRSEPDKVTQNVTALRDALTKLAQPAPGPGISLDVTTQIADRLVREVDTAHGGLGGAPKFPQVPIFELFWRAWKRTGDARYRDAVTVTLTHMAQGGIYDHLGGGFARYAVDATWLVPHFEKMLYDNAELVDLLTLVWQETRDPLYEVRVRETIGWVLREMRAPPGQDSRQAFASSLDADSEGEEGKFYVWTEAEVDRVLGDDAPLFKATYGVRPGGNWEGKTILNRLGQPALGDAAFEAKMEACRARLFAARETRVRPGWDDKILADWNGLMIAALANAAIAFREPAWLTAAREAFAFIRDRMSIEGQDRLLHSWRNGQAKHAATLDDYAHLCRAALALHEATGAGTYLAQARRWVETLDRHYWDGANGGYFFTADDAGDLIVRTKNAADSAIPSGNGTMVGVLARLHHLTGETTYRDRADALVAAFAGEIGRNVFPLATLLNNNELLQNALQVVIVGRRGEDDTEALLQALAGRSLPNRVLTVLPPGESLPPNHPAAGKPQIDGRATAYVCRGPTCSLPIAEPGGLGQALALG